MKKPIAKSIDRPKMGKVKSGGKSSYTSSSMRLKKSQVQSRSADRHDVPANGN
jgi:hypothetical protein